MCDCGHASLREARAEVIATAPALIARICVEVMTARDLERPAQPTALPAVQNVLAAEKEEEEEEEEEAEAADLGPFSAGDN